MAINLKFDLMGNPEPPSIVLANRNGNKLGQLNVNVESIDVNDKFNAASEFSFTLNKYIDNEPTLFWDKVVDFKLVYCPEWDLWFEIKVELDETTETVKTVFCTQLGQAELSQIMVYNIHINEEGDPNWDTNNETYKSTILYDPQNTDASLLHRLLKDKAPHYSIAYVDESIQRIQKTFSFDDTSICDAFNEIAAEIGCLFVYNSNSTKGGKPNRTISVYDLQQNCNDCGHRGEFTDKCPKCESTNIKYGYGEDTLIFVTSDELATEGIQLVTDTDAVKNCFKLEGGDDLMTATIRNCNPNGSDYIWYFSDSIKEDMSKELVEKLESYDDKYQNYYKNYISELNETSVNQYNTLVTKYKEYYDTESACLNCGHEDYFQEQCPKCNSKNILVGQKLQTMPTEIKGYSDLMTAYYNTIDLLLYLESGLMPKPDIEANKTSAEEQLTLLTTSSLSPVAVNVKEVKNISESTAKSAVLSMAKVLVKSTYKVDVVDNSSSLDETVYTNDTIGEYKKWTGRFIVTNYSDEEDSATSETIEVYVGNDAKTFVEQKINKALNKENTDDYSITGLFAKEYDDFCVELKKYALNPLDNFSKACDSVISILQEQGIGTDGSNENDELEKEKKKALYDALYKPYFDKQQAINDEIKIRENEITIIEGVWDKSDENNPKCTTNGLQQYIEECQQDIQKELDFEKHLGEYLWLEFCAYRREDKYSNSNYVSDGLNNAELFERANEFIEVAEEEIFKSAELQHSISATLNNLLSFPKFKPLLKSFKTGNWIRVQVDDIVYKLRLLEYGFGYGDSESISVEFSDVTKIKNGVTDVKEILEQATSMASSYDSVQRQAEKGNLARGTIDQWLTDGLNSANVQISSNDSEEILLTKNGLLARSYDDITGTYAPEQFKLTHNIMAYTDDNWKTVASALGKHHYNRWNGSSFVDDEGYGLTSKFVTAGYITGSQIIGGEILSSNYEPKTKGTYINLLKGDFDFAGGRIVYDANDNNVILKGVTIQWTGDDGVNAPDVKVENITGLDKYLDQLEDLEDQLDGRAQTWYQSIDPSTEWTTDELKSLHIGDLWHYTGETNTINGVERIKNSEWIWQEVNGSYQWVAIEISDLVFDAIDGKAQIFTSTPTPPYYVGDLWVQGSTGDILHCIATRESGSYNENDWVKSSKYTDDTKADAAYGLADSAKSVADNAKIIGDKLVNGLGFQETEITGEYIISPVIAGGHLLIGDTSGTYAQITTDGLLQCANAKINGDIVANSLTLQGAVTGLSYDDLEDKPDISKLVNDAIKDGSIIIETSDVEITEESLGNGITKVTTTVGDNTYTTYSSDSANYILTDLGFGTEPDDYSSDYTSGYFKVSKEGLLIANNAIIWGTIYATDGKFSGDIEADSLTLREDIKLGNDTDGYHTWINKDGTLSTIDANISGEIRAISGQIGGFTIKPNDVENDIVYGYLYSGEFGKDKSIFLSATDMAGTMPFYNLIERTDDDGNAVYDENDEVIYDVEQSDLEMEDWRITVGTNFGVTSDGTAYMSNCEIVGGSLRMGTTSDGYHTWISSDGVLNASGANIDGKITAVEGVIAGWDITKDGIEKNGVVGMSSSDNSYVSLVDTNTQSPIRLYAGDMANTETKRLTFTSTGETLTRTIALSEKEQAMYKVVGAQSLTTTKVHSGGVLNQQVTVTTSLVGMNNVYSGSATYNLLPTWVLEEHITTMYSTNNRVSLIYLGNGQVQVRATSEIVNDIVADTVTIEYSFTETLDINVAYDDTTVSVVFNPQLVDAKYNIDIEYILSRNYPSFAVLEDGSLYASAADIAGHIEAESGNIGALQIKDGGLKYIDNNIDVYSLDESGLIINPSAAKVQVGNVTLKYSNEEESTLLETSNSLIIRGQNETQLCFMANNGASSVVSNVKIFCKYDEDSTTILDDAFSAYLYIDKPCLYDETIIVQCQYANAQDYVTHEESLIFTFNSGTQQTEAKSLVYEGDIFEGLTRKIRFRTVDGSWSQWITSDNEAFTEVCIIDNFEQIQANNYIEVKGHFIPQYNSTDEGVGYNLGISTCQWDNVYARNGAIEQSDRQVKQNIEPLSDAYSQIFDSLKPVSYKFKVNNNNRTHTGFIAQEVKEAIKNAGLTTQDFAAYCEWDNNNGAIGCGLRYSEFISMCVNEIQKLKKRVAELENK